MPEIMLNGPEGHLEARYHEGNGPNAPIAVVLHPHPLYGGTMNNKVAFKLFRAFADAGFAVLRFNFRGVEGSEGTHDDGNGELDDALAALDWLEHQNPDHGAVWIAGFSFGGWIAAKALMARSEIEGFVLIAPAANKYDFAFLDPCPCDGLIIQGTADDIVPAPSVQALAAHLAEGERDVKLAIVEGAGHFFEKQMDELQGHIDGYLAERFGDQA